MKEYGGYPYLNSGCSETERLLGTNQDFFNPANSPILNELRNSQTVKIKQRVNKCETCGNICGCSCECSNIFDVFIEDRGQNKHILELEEINGCLWKCCIMPCWRSFKMDVRQVLGEGKEKKTQTLCTIDRPCKCGFNCCCRPELTAYISGCEIGKVVNPCECISSDFVIYGPDAKIKYIIKFKCCQCWDYRGDIMQGESDVIVGSVVKDCSCTEICTHAGTYHANLPVDADAKDRLNIIAGLILCDYRKFE